MCSGKLNATDTADRKPMQCRIRFEKKRKICICRISFEWNYLWSLSSCLKWIWREVLSPGTVGTKATFDRQTQVCSQKEGGVIMIGMRVVLCYLVELGAVAPISECSHFHVCYTCHLKVIRCESWDLLQPYVKSCRFECLVFVHIHYMQPVFVSHTPGSFQWRQLPCQPTHATLEINSAPLNIKPDLNVWKKSKSDLGKRERKKKKCESAK